MKEKILTELKKKYSGQLTVKFMESLADRLAINVKDEKEIEGALSELDKSHIKITDLQAEGDRRATELQNQIQLLQGELTKLKEVKPPEPGKPDESGGFLTELKTLKQELEDFKKLDRQREARAKLTERAKEKKIPSMLIETAQIESLDQLETVLSSLEEKSTALRQEFKNSELKSNPPAKGQGTPATEIQNEIKAHPVKK